MVGDIVKAMGRAVVRAAAAWRGTRPVNVEFLRRTRRLASGVDPLLPYRWRRHVGSELSHRRLSELLADTELGTWSLGPRSLEFLRRRIEDVRPRVVLEFGSGVSTVCIAQFLADSGEDGRIVSIEQSSDAANDTRALLARLGLTDRALVLEAPLETQPVLGHDMSVYRIDDVALDAAMDGASAEIVLIDGPAAEDGARYATLPRVLRHVAPGATFVLDDALRDGELMIARQWALLDGVEVDGVVLIEHGMLVGTVKGGVPCASQS